jgi:hypothetical protein
MPVDIGPGPVVESVWPVAAARTAAAIALAVVEWAATYQCVADIATPFSDFIYFNRLYKGFPSHELFPPRVKGKTYAWENVVLG